MIDRLTGKEKESNDLKVLNPSFWSSEEIANAISMDVL
jgi:hypothetical protein